MNTLEEYRVKKDKFLKKFKENLTLDFTYGKKYYTITLVGNILQITYDTIGENTSTLEVGITSQELLDYADDNYTPKGFLEESFEIFMEDFLTSYISEKIYLEVL